MGEGNYNRATPQIELVKLKALLPSIDEQDLFLVNWIETYGLRDLPETRIQVIESIFDDVEACSPGLVRSFRFHIDAEELRAQIRPARWKMQGRIDELNIVIQDPRQITVTPSAIVEAEDKRRVFVVYGRNREANDATFAFLRALDLDPIEWGEAIKMANKGTPHPEEVLRAAFSNAQAGVILFTGDDVARLGKRYLTAHDPPDERSFTPQVRPNVLFEAGMAWGTFSDRTIIVELGRTRELSDIKGLHTIRISNSVARRQALADRLRSARCLVKTEGRTDWHTAGDFDSAFHQPDSVGGAKQTGLKVVRRQASPEPAATFKPKVYVEIRNDTGECIEIRHLEWERIPSGIQVKYGPSSFQLKLGKYWCPEKEGVDRLQVPPSEMFKIWAQPTEEYDMANLEARCSSEGQIAHVSMLVNDVRVQILV